MPRYALGESALPTSIILSLGCTGVALAQCPFEKMTKWEVPGPPAGFQFGYSVALGPARVAIGFPESMGGGSIAVFDITGDDSSFSSLITADDGNGGDFLGGSDAGSDTALAMHGDRIAVGASGDDDAGDSFGAVYVFDLVDGQWTQTAKLLGSKAFGGFGKAVALEGDRLAAYESGTVRIFDLVDAEWTQTSVITGDTFGFGQALALDAGRLLIGEHTSDVAGEASGAASIYEHNGSGWSKSGTLVPGDLEADDHFGHSVDLQGDFAVIGAPEKNTDDLNDAGAVYVFHHAADTWSGKTMLIAPQVESGARFGNAVAIDGPHVAVGAWLEDVSGSITGAAYLFTRSESGKWSPQQLFGHAESGHDDWMGNSVDVVAGVVAVGAPQAIEGQLSGGAAYLFNSAGKDCNGNGVFDACDVALSYSFDCNGDGIPDECNIDDGTLDDCNSNGLADLCEFTDTYALDDNTPEAAFSASSGGPIDDIWLNAFVVEPGMEVVAGLNISWWQWVPPASWEWPATLLLYDDPTNDGIPDDAVLIRALDITLRQTDAGEFVTYPIPPTGVGAAGELFFVGIRLTENPLEFALFSPLVVDQNSANQASSWLALASAGQSDIGNLMNNDILPPTPLSTACPSCAGDWLIRALPAGAVDCCAADLDSNRAVGPSDLAQLLSAWGENPDHPADLSGDGAVGPADLATLLAAWGPCS